MTTLRLVAAVMLLSLGCRTGMGQAVAPPPRPEESADVVGGLKVDPDPAKLNAILGDLHAGKSQEALVQANEMLHSYPDSLWLNCAAGEAAVASNDRLSLHLAVERLKRLVPEGQEACVAKLGTQYKRMTGTAELRQRALDLVKAGRLDEARRVVASAHLDPYEDLLIEHYLDRAQTHFTNALSRLKQLRAIPSAADEAASLQEETMQQAREFRDLRERGQTYLFDPVATSACEPKSAGEMFSTKGLALEEFLSKARDLVREYPSHPDVQQFYFMALVLAGSDESLKRYGNSVLERYGTLSIPFFSRDTLYLLVLDRRQRRITLKENPAHAKNLGLTDGLRIGQAFDLPYAAVLSLHQVVSSDLNTLSLSEKSAAVDLGAQGIAPYYALMTTIHCLYGERYQRRATERLGKFLAEELGIPADRVKLVNPENTTHDALGAVVSAMTITSMAVSQTAIQHQQQVAVNNEMARQNLGLQQIQADQIQSAGQNILDQRQNEAGDRQEVNDAQRTDAASLEQQLAEQGFNRALDLDVPGYLEILAGMLRNHN